MTQPDSQRSLLSQQAEPLRQFVDPQARSVPELLTRLGVHAVVATVIGLLAGFIWNVLGSRPSYVMGNSSVASTSERALTQFFAADARFVVLGLVGGLILGWVSWARFGRRGWVVVPIALAVAAWAALCAWGFGIFLDAGDFSSRIAQAKPGDRVPIDLALQAKAALLVWPFAAVLPVLVAASLSDDEAGPGLATRLRLRRARRRPPRV